MDRQLIERLARPVPRYTSFPTAPHFNTSVGHEDYSEWLGSLAPGAHLSLYVHVPFCDSLCWFCGCTTKIVRRYDPVAAYLGSLVSEIGHVARFAAAGRPVTHIHWGGGSPDILAPDDILRLADMLQTRFTVAADAEFAVEIDPRAMDEDKVRAFTQAGLTRLSIGVQDFDPAVQESINRIQSFEQTRSVVERFRSSGVRSVNIDLIYGLPHQTLQSAIRTAEQVLSLEPGRIALFGYAHLPQRIRHQRLIPEHALPDIFQRYALAEAVAQRLVEADYLRIGLDHFCKPDDALAAAQLRRNFQGYTDDAADILIGFGASAISRLPQGYAQNAVPVADYRRRIEAKRLATARGIQLSSRDRAIAYAIERLMCDMRFPARDITERFGDAGAALNARAELLVSSDRDGLVRPEAGGFAVTEKGRPFLRAICAWFDPYLEASTATHSVGV